MSKRGGRVARAEAKVQLAEQRPERAFFPLDIKVLQWNSRILLSFVLSIRIRDATSQGYQKAKYCRKALQAGGFGLTTIHARVKVNAIIRDYENSHDSPAGCQRHHSPFNTGPATQPKFLTKRRCEIVSDRG